MVHIYLKDFGSSNPRKEFYCISHIIAIGVVKDLPYFKMAHLTAKSLITLMLLGIFFNALK